MAAVQTGLIEKPEHIPNCTPNTKIQTLHQNLYSLQYSDLKKKDKCNANTLRLQYGTVAVLLNLCLILN